MIRLRMFAASLIILAAATLISIYPGQMTLNWLGYKIIMPVGMVFSLLLAFFFIMIHLHKLWVKLWKLPNRYRRHLQNRRLQKADELLIGSITAIAAGRHDEAKQFCELARELTPDNPLGMFLSSQAAQNLGDFAESERIFMRMSESPHLRFLGLRGLYLQAKQHGDWLTGRKYLQQIIKLHPDSPWLVGEVCRNEILIAYFNLPQAAGTNGAQRHLTRAAAQRHEAALMWCKYKNPIRHLKDEESLPLLQKIHSHAPDWVIPSIRLAEFHVNRNSAYKAQKVLAAAYKANPHRSIAILWRTLAKNPQDPVGLYNFLSDLTGCQPDHYESRIILAKAAIEAKLWGQAESHLERLSLMNLNQKVCRLWAEYYEAGPVNRKHKSREWWIKASQASSDRMWICAACGRHHEIWDIICGYCHAVDSIAWADPAQTQRVLTEITEAAAAVTEPVRYLKYQQGEHYERSETGILPGV